MVLCDTLVNRNERRPRHWPRKQGIRLLETWLRRLFIILLSGVCLLVVLHFLSRSLLIPIHERFNLNEEANFPTWYSTILLFSVAAMFRSHILFLQENRAPSKALGISFGWLLALSIACCLWTSAAKFMKSLTVLSG